MLSLARKHKSANPDRYLGYALKRYGITADAYRSLLVSQDGKCAICRTDKDRHRFSVDHDHDTGTVRGLLCGHCNRGIGCFRDNPEALIAAASYLSSRAK